MFNKCHLIWKWTTWKNIFRHNSCIGIYMKYLQVDRRKIKRWSIHWGMQSSIGNTWVPLKIICILDYCKTKACLIGFFCHFNGAIIISCRCVKLLILGYISVQVEDSKVGEMIYVMPKVKLKLNLSEIQGKYTALAKIVKIVTDLLFYPNWPKL